MTFIEWLRQTHSDAMHQHMASLLLFTAVRWLYAVQSNLDNREPKSTDMSRLVQIRRNGIQGFPHFGHIRASALCEVVLASATAGQNL